MRALRHHPPRRQNQVGLWRNPMWIQRLRVLQLRRRSRIRTLFPPQRCCGPSMNEPSNQQCITLDDNQTKPHLRAPLFTKTNEGTCPERTQDHHPMAPTPQQSISSFFTLKGENPITHQGPSTSVQILAICTFWDFYSGGSKTHQCNTTFLIFHTNFMYIFNFFAPKQSKKNSR
jgi:hypothetical protein